MTQKSRQRGIEELIRRRGGRQPPRVEPLVFEARSDFVPCMPPEPGKGEEFLLGAIVVIWQFCLSGSDIKEFHAFLKRNESDIARLLAEAENGATYAGTYMVVAGADACSRPITADACYRTIFRYESFRALCNTAAFFSANPKSGLYSKMMQLRSFWLRDPHRSEVRTSPARSFLDSDKDAGDGFAKLTLAAAEANLGKGTPSRQKRSRTTRTR